MTAHPNCPTGARSTLTADAIVIGGGFYGCETALELRRLGFARVMLFEREKKLLQRASFVNQARVHNGYHYPRDFATARKSCQNFEAFVDEYADAVQHDLESHYAIARGSRVTADQFANFCERIGAPCRPSRRDIAQIFESGAIEQVFAVRELAFDTVRIAARLSRQLAAARVDVRLGSEARVTAQDDAGVSLDLSGACARAAYVFNCTYAEIEMTGAPLRTGIRKELTEMVLIQPPPQLRGKAFTVMDGPFFSTMPFPSTDLHTLSHVRYTPHEASDAANGSMLRPTRSHAEEIIRDASRYLPCLSRATVIRSIFEIKAVLVRSDKNDARPILIERSDGSGRVLSILGSKIDNVYELRDFLRAQVWH